jgi:hypothetical protein
MSDTKKLTVRNVIDAHHGISSLIDSDKRNKFVLSSATRIKLAGNLRKTKAVFEDYETERTALVQELGSKDDKGNVTVTPENQDKFATTLKAALDQETDVTLNPVTTEAIFGCTEDEEKSGKKPNQIDIDLVAFMQEIGLVTE